MLNAVDWSIHRAIKLSRLEMLLEDNHRDMTDRVAQVSALENAQWDVVKAATMLISNWENWCQFRRYNMEPYITV